MGNLILGAILAGIAGYFVCKIWDCRYGNEKTRKVDKVDDFDEFREGGEGRRER